MQGYDAVQAAHIRRQSERSLNERPRVVPVLGTQMEVDPMPDARLDRQEPRLWWLIVIPIGERGRPTIEHTGALAPRL